MAEELSIDSGALIFATLADVYLSSGMIDEAISILKDGLSRNPTYTLAKVILGRAYYMKGDCDEALKVLDEVYKEKKDSENTNLYMGHCYRKRGEYEKAIKFYEAVININPKNTEAKQELAALRPELVKEEAGVTQPAEPGVTPAAVEAAVEEELAKPFEEGEAEGAAPVKPTAEAVQAESAGAEEGTETLAQPGSPEKTEGVPAEEAIEEEPTAEDATAALGEEEKPGEETALPSPPSAEEKIVEEGKEKVEPGTKVEQEVEAIAVPIEVQTTEEKPVKMPEPSVEETAEPVALPLESLEAPMKRLLKNKTVKGAFISSKDGLLIKNYYQERSDVEEICALIAAIHSEAEDSFKFLKEGEVDKIIVQKDDETICVITAGESLLTVITLPETKPGLVFVYARKIIDEIREILG
jgi:predicted regulator of Ras-like GTPase activity (Roadblock/LC7/MglB family)